MNIFPGEDVKPVKRGRPVGSLMKVEAKTKTKGDTKGAGGSMQLQIRGEDSGKNDLLQNVTRQLRFTLIIIFNNFSTGYQAIVEKLREENRQLNQQLLEAQQTIKALHECKNDLLCYYYNYDFLEYQFQGILFHR